MNPKTPMDSIDPQALNPIRLWRDWIVKSETQWSEAVSQFLKNERVGGAVSRQIDEMQLMQRQFSEFAQASLAAANLPSRSDLEALGDRMGRLEDGLAQLAASVSQLREAIILTIPDAQAKGALTKPTRNRRPAQKPANKTTSVSKD